MSTLKSLVLAALRTGCKSFAFPDTAANGEDLEAFFAGDLAARSTVRSPTQMPAMILGMLMLKIGMPPKYIGLSHLKTKHISQTTIVPVTTPMGIASRHQWSASLRTNRITCFGVAPTQRSNPKNSILCATLLFRLLVIIRIPAHNTRTNRTIAAPYTCIIKALLL